MKVQCVASCLGLALLCLLPACGGLKTYHTVLSPSQTAQDCKADNDSAATACLTPCGLAQMGLACREGLAVGKLLDLKKQAPEVGFFRKYDPGTQPCPCWEWMANASRAYVNFALQPGVPDGLPVGTTIEKVVVAKLTWDPSSKHTGSSQPSNLPPHCFKRLYEATGPWKAFATPGNLITDELDPSAKSLFITQVVQKWVQAGGGQFGLFFTATDESLPSKNNKVCETTLNSLKLELTYLGKQQIWP